MSISIQTQAKNTKFAHTKQRKKARHSLFGVYVCVSVPLALWIWKWCEFNNFPCFYDGSMLELLPERKTPKFDQHWPNMAPNFCAGGGVILGDDHKEQLFLVGTTETTFLGIIFCLPTDFFMGSMWQPETIRVFFRVGCEIRHVFEGGARLTWCGEVRNFDEIKLDWNLICGLKLSEIGRRSMLKI